MGGTCGIDFQRSSVTWLLPEQPSHGRFAIDAALRTPDGEDFYLCAQVFAGNVYADEALFKEPPYEFSAAFSATRFAVFRDAARGPAQEDSHGAVAERFRTVRIDVRRAPTRAVAAADLPELADGTLAARVRLEHGELEFPVRHVNWRPDGKYQAETGPVLVCLPGGGNALLRLRRAYAAWGSSNRVDFLIDERRPSEPGLRWSRRMTTACEIGLYHAQA